MTTNWKDKIEQLPEPARSEAQRVAAVLDGGVLAFLSMPEKDRVSMVQRLQQELKEKAAGFQIPVTISTNTDEEKFARAVLGQSKDMLSVPVNAVYDMVAYAYHYGEGTKIVRLSGDEASEVAYHAGKILSDVQTKSTGAGGFQFVAWISAAFQYAVDFVSHWGKPSKTFDEYQSAYKQEQEQTGALENVRAKSIALREKLQNVHYGEGKTVGVQLAQFIAGVDHKDQFTSTAAFRGLPAFVSPEQSTLVASIEAERKEKNPDHYDRLKKAFADKDPMVVTAASLMVYKGAHMLGAPIPSPWVATKTVVGGSARMALGGASLTWRAAPSLLRFATNPYLAAGALIYTFTPDALNPFNTGNIPNDVQERQSLAVGQFVSRMPKTEEAANLIEDKTLRALVITEIRLQAMEKAATDLRVKIAEQDKKEGVSWRIFDTEDHKRLNKLNADRIALDKTLNADLLASLQGNGLMGEDGRLVKGAPLDSISKIFDDAQKTYEASKAVGTSEKRKQTSALEGFSSAELAAAHEGIIEQTRAAARSAGLVVASTEPTPFARVSQVQLLGVTDVTNVTNAGETSQRVPSGISGKTESHVVAAV